MDKLVKLYTKFVDSNPDLNIAIAHDLVTPYDENGIRYVLVIEAIEVSIAVNEIYCRYNHIVESRVSASHLLKEHEGFVELHTFLMSYFLKAGVVLSGRGDVEKGKINYQAVFDLVSRVKRYGVEMVPTSLEDWSKA